MRIEQFPYNFLCRISCLVESSFQPLIGLETNKKSYGIWPPKDVKVFLHFFTFLCTSLLKRSVEQNYIPKNMKNLLPLEVIVSATTVKIQTLPYQNANENIAVIVKKIWRPLVAKPLRFPSPLHYNFCLSKWDLFREEAILCVCFDETYLCFLFILFIRKYPVYHVSLCI